MTIDESLDVGVDTRTGVDDKDYQVPFRFTGKLGKVKFKLIPPPPERKSSSSKKRRKQRMRRSRRADTLRTVRTFRSSNAIQTPYFVPPSDHQARSNPPSARRHHRLLGSRC